MIKKSAERVLPFVPGGCKVIEEKEITMTQAKQPTLTPLEAYTRFKAEGQFKLDGFEYCQNDYDDAPIAEDLSSGECFFVEGEVGGEVTAESKWVC